MCQQFTEQKLRKKKKLISTSGSRVDGMAGALTNWITETKLTDNEMNPWQV